VVCGSTHSLVVAEDGDLFGFGDNTYGQLGLGGRIRSLRSLLFLSVFSIVRGVCVFGASCSSFDDGFAGQDAAFEPTLVTLSAAQPQNPDARPPRIGAVACGQRHSLVLLASGEIHAAGANEFGQLGYLLSRFTTRSLTRVSTRAVDGNRTLFTRVECPPARAIACGAHHTAALVVAAWGDVKQDEELVEPSEQRATDVDGDASGDAREDEEVVARRAKLLAMPELRVPAADEERQLLMWGRADQGT
jgi:alpha-tubulin suppressor-like RCC1 family protein